MTVENTDQAVADVLDAGQRWAKAELQGDKEGLADLLTSDFVGIGPRGFVLDKQAWLARHDPGALIHDSFTWRDVEVRVYGDAAVAVGIEETSGKYGRHRVRGRSRGTHVLVRVDGAWLMAGIHLSAA